MKKTSLFFCLLLTACAFFHGAGETVYFNDDSRSFELGLGISQNDIMQEVGSPHKVVLSDSGFHYWEYCYVQDGDHLHIDGKDYPFGCNALRLYFDPQKKLIDYTKTSNIP